MNVIELFDRQRLDLFVLTSYPYVLSEINQPEDIPDDYYRQVADLVPGKRFGFSEVGWSSHPAFGGESAQADFVRMVAGRLTRDQGVNLFIMGWSWLTDLSDTDDIGRKRRDSTAKPAWLVWQELFGC